MNSNASPAMRVGAAVAFAAILGGVVYGLRAPEPTADKRRAVVQWAQSKGPTAATRCLRTSALADPRALALFGLVSDAGPQYVHVRLCADPSDAGEMPTLPEGMTSLEATQVEEAYDGGPEMIAALQGEPEFEHACAPRGGSCEWIGADGGWGPAPQNLTLSPGQWRGGCLRKTGVELAGTSSMLEACK